MTTTLKALEERLSREMPAFEWQCRAGTQSTSISGTEMPQEIVIAAACHAAPVAGSPWHLNGQMLIRWGVDATAKMICNEYNADHAVNSNRNGPGWDKLAEI